MTPRWIPGDWGLIMNTAAKRNPDNWVRDRNGRLTGRTDENVFHITTCPACGELFWGHFEDGLHPPYLEGEWFEKIRGWVGNDGIEHGDPAWRETITYPQRGLEPDHYP